MQFPESFSQPCICEAPSEQFHRNLMWSEATILNFNPLTQSKNCQIRIAGSWGRGFSERKGSSLLSIYAKIQKCWNVSKNLWGSEKAWDNFFFSWLVAQSPLATSHCLRCQNLNENLVGQLHGRNGSQDHQPILENLSGFGPIYDM